MERAKLNRSAQEGDLQLRLRASNVSNPKRWGCPMRQNKRRRPGVRTGLLGETTPGNLDDSVDHVAELLRFERALGCVVPQEDGGDSYRSPYKKIEPDRPAQCLRLVLLLLILRLLFMAGGRVALVKRNSRCLSLGDGADVAAVVEDQVAVHRAYQHLLRAG